MASDDLLLEPLEPSGESSEAEVEDHTSAFRRPAAIAAIALAIGLVVGVAVGSLLAAARNHASPSTSTEGFVRRCPGQSGFLLLSAAGLEPGADLRIAVARGEGREVFINPGDGPPSVAVALDGLGANEWRSDASGKLTVVARPELDFDGRHAVAFAIYPSDDITTPLRRGHLQLVDCGS